MINRMLADLLRRRLAQFPAVTLVGPRQCGKTTLARALARLRQVAAMVGADQLTLICRVRDSVLGRGLTVVNLPDYLGRRRRRAVAP